MMNMEQEFYAMVRGEILMAMVVEHDFVTNEMSKSELLRLQGHLENIVDNPPDKLKKAPKHLVSGAVQVLCAEISKHVSSMNDTATASLILK